MFHTYVTASSGRKIDVDRAWYLMDKGLLDEARARALRDEIDSNDEWKRETKRLGLPGHDRLPFNETVRAWNLLRLTWSLYCDLHEAKYGEPFEPDHSLSWDA